MNTNATSIIIVMWFSKEFLTKLFVNNRTERIYQNVINYGIIGFKNVISVCANFELRRDTILTIIKHIYHHHTIYVYKCIIKMSYDSQ